MLTRRVLPLSLAAAAVQICSPRRLLALPSRELFTLARSTNANVVKYAVRTGRDGRLDLANPVEAYWLMLAENGRREELTWTERQLAYGFSVAAVRSDGFVLRLAACAERALRVRAIDGAFVAELPILRQPAVLRRIFVQTDARALIPSVRYVELSGFSANRQLVVERIAPH